jgi:hypothetical protein
MEVFLTIIVILIVIVLAFRFPRFGVVLLGVITLLIALIVLIVLQATKDQDESKKRIATREIVLMDLAMRGPDSSIFPEIRTLTGRARNNSSGFTLTGVELKLTMYDCIDKGCETVGQTRKHLFLRVPPGQPRDFEETIYFSGLRKPRGKHEWRYEVLSTTAEP